MHFDILNKSVSLYRTPKYENESIDLIIEHACREADIYKKNGLDAVLLENMHDVPYLNRTVGPEIVAGMTAVCSAVKREVTKMPCGIQILAGCNEQAIAVAKVCNFDFIRAEGFVFSHIADEGMMNSDAGNLLRYRKQINAESVMVFADIKKKHSSHSITDDLGLEDVAKAAQFFLSDGVVITGTHTGSPVEVRQIELIKQSNVQLPVLIGSGVTQHNLSSFMDANGLIIGSYFKKNGDWRNEIDVSRLPPFMDQAQHLRMCNN